MVYNDYSRIPRAGEASFPPEWDGRDCPVLLLFTLPKEAAMMDVLKEDQVWLAIPKATNFTSLAEITK